MDYLAIVVVSSLLAGFAVSVLDHVRPSALSLIRMAVALLFSSLLLVTDSTYGWIQDLAGVGAATFLSMVILKWSHSLSAAKRIG